MIFKIILCDIDSVIVKTRNLYNIFYIIYIKMGNCISCCIIEPYDYSPTEYLFINKKNESNKKDHKKQIASYYDSCVF